MGEVCDNCGERVVPDVKGIFWGTDWWHPLDDHDELGVYTCTQGDVVGVATVAGSEQVIEEDN